MRKRFNITGSCNPQLHYMVNTENRFKAVRELIELGEYFTINRARQYGKTTMLDMIWNRLSDQYLVVPMSFEGVGSSAFESEEAFAEMFARLMSRHLIYMIPNVELIEIWQNPLVSSMDELSVLISDFCMKSPKPVVLTVDEVDKSCDNQLFLNFLGMLRNKYLGRNREGMESTFLSVVLAGVYDVKNMKLKIRTDAEK